jgi:hypothetical protein
MSTKKISIAGCGLPRDDFLIVTHVDHQLQHLFHSQSIFLLVTDAMGFTTAWKRLSPTQLNIAIQAFALISIFFEGYDQGVMGGVNASPNYVTEVKIGLPDGTVTNTTKQGGIVSIVSVGSIS